MTLQGPSRGEIWEGAADDCLQSRRTLRSQVETTVGNGQCHFLHVHRCIWDCSCTCMTIWMTNSSLAKDNWTSCMQHPSGDAGGHYL